LSPRTIVLPEEEMMEFKYSEAQEVEEIANQLISEVAIHEQLAEARILYFFRTGTWNSKGKRVWGMANKIPEQWQYVTGYDLVVTINKDVWYALDENQKKALVDHELCHFCREENDEGETKWLIVGHDVEEFSGVIRRHGLWKEDVKAFAKETQRQMSIFEVMDGGKSSQAQD